ncbi:UPF0364 protein [Escovopsis weberi]|uniref:Sugar phosphate phosphatase n=1 Tax=Escovopsis weberi TaxID=150374 RepID=A0A0M8N3L6_ESCWE|nr:UPF0364 protein [Escovopsis weberi]
MEYDTAIPKAVTSDPSSFAHESVRTRWPIILTGVVDDVYKSVSQCDDPEKQAEGKQIVAQLGNLKYELLHDRKLTPLVDDGFSQEIAMYNKELEALGNTSWLDAPWLFSECYMYRRMYGFFLATKHWNTYDPFARQKIDSFRTSRSAVIELATRYKDIIAKLKANKDVTHDREAEKLLFIELCEVCLWGNATDLSLLANMSFEDIQKLQGSEARKTAEQNILVNDLPATYEILKKAQAEGRKERRVDFVLDNAGFELYVDLILAGFMLNTGLATQVILRPKSMPWFVSDVVPADFSVLLNALASPKAFFESPSEEESVSGETPAPLADSEIEGLLYVFQDWATLHAEGQLTLRPDRYWTAGGSYWRLPGEHPELHKDLKDAELVIFKGDLNYRKLVSDANWDPTTPFTTAIGTMGSGEDEETKANFF